MSSIPATVTEQFIRQLDAFSEQIRRTREEVVQRTSRGAAGGPEAGASLAESAGIPAWSRDALPPGG